MTHSHCTHPATKAARAKCRRENVQPVISTAPLPADPFDLLPEVEDDWVDPDSFFGTGDDSGSGDADLLDR